MLANKVSKSVHCEFLIQQTSLEPHRPPPHTHFVPSLSFHFKAQKAVNENFERLPVPDIILTVECKTNQALQCSHDLAAIEQQKNSWQFKSLHVFQPVVNHLPFSMYFFVAPTFTISASCSLS